MVLRYAGQMFFRLAILTLPVCSEAQENCPPVQTVEPVPFCRLDRKPARLALELPSLYPPVLRQARISGMVQLEFVLDSIGGALPSSIHFLSSTNAAFEGPIRAMLEEQRFDAPVYEGRNVLARVRIEAEFIPPGLDTIPQQEALSEEPVATGWHWRVYWRPIRREVQASHLSPAERDDIIRAVVLAGPLPASTEPQRALCIEIPAEWRSKALDRTTLAALRTRRPTIVAANRCPRTYTTWVITPNAPPRPSGSLDPDFVSLGGLEVWTAGLVRVPLRTGRGLSGSLYICEARRGPKDQQDWAVTCHYLSQWVS